MDEKTKGQLPETDLPSNVIRFTRRAWVKGASVLAGGSAASAILAGTGCSLPAPGGASGPEGCGTTLEASSSHAIVESTAGKVQGYTRNGIITFKGIPYGGTTEGSGRFMPPSKPQPWEGVRSTKQYGPVSPQEARAGWANDELAWLFNWNDGQQGDDCLRLNVWTPGLNDGKKRPVLVWLHGGGFSAGSGHELPSYPGENMSRRGDVVVVSVNHRLGVVGFLNLAEIGGEKYAQSANVGMLDLVAALEWVRDNIANFGGDPGNVLIFGQSGGGAKVSTLMTMPAAKGLFHKAVVQSGSMLSANKPEDSAKLAAAVLAELGISADRIDEIQGLPYSRLVEAGMEAVKKLNESEGPSGGSLPRLRWGPTVDGTDLPGDPFTPAAPEISADVPMLIGTVQHEWSLGLFNAQFAQMTSEELEKQLAATQGDKAGAVLEAFRKTYPEATPVELATLIATGGFRQGAVTQAERKAEQGKAAAFAYLFTWRTPILDGRPLAFHCSELAFVFDNTDNCAEMTGGGPAPRELAAKVSDAWIQFARTGNPNHPGLPSWPAYSVENPQAMRFDTACEVIRNDFDLDARKSLEQG